MNVKPTYEELEKRIQKLEKKNTRLEKQDGRYIGSMGIVSDITERRRTEEENRRFRMIADIAVYGKAIADLQGNLLYVNPFFANIHGYEPEQLMGKHFHLFHNQEQLKEVNRLMAYMMRDGHFAPTTVWHCHQDGTKFPMLMSGVLLRDRSDKPQGIAVSAIDITASHQAEQNFQMLFHKMLDGFALHEIICDDSGTPVDYRFLDINPAFERMTGLKAASVKGRTVKDVLPNTEISWIKTYGEVALSGAPVTFENHSAEIGKHFQVTAFCPAPGQFACIFQDITERKQAEELNRKNAERVKMQRNLIAQLTFNDSIINSSIDDALKILTCKLAATLQVDRVSVWLLSENETRLKRLVLHDAQTGPHSQLDDLNTGDIPSYFEALRKNSLIDADDAQNDTRTQELTDHYLIPLKISSLLDSAIQQDGRLIGVLSAEHRGPIRQWHTDEESFLSAVANLTAQLFANTERKQAEAEREKLQAQLSQAQKLESVGRLAGGVAHDFNNMLGVILGHTELALLKAEEDNDLISDLKEIQKAAKRSADITKQLLAFARKQTISPKQLDLNTTVESMLNMLRRLIGEDIDLVWQPTAHLWSVKMDPSQIDQILANLCVNARDAIAGVGKLTIETGKKTFDKEYCKEHAGFIPGDFVLLAVSDNGCGMSKDTQDNLFEPFFTTKEVSKGTGLGLATIYGIVKQNDGFINVYSEPDQGSTFKIYLPRVVTDEDNDKAIPEKKAAAGGTETILLVEDEPSILRMTRMMLERKGYTVLTATTPAEAVEKAKNHTDKIHLLMTDVVMPEMNGRDLSGKITDLYPDIRLLFMSGYTANVIAHQGVLDDGVAFIQKPFSMADMAEKVREVLDKSC
ncbi:MAG: PAS domain S-box protein [Desulfotignum sp.]|nr:PAS domain S-box protein [Desulfotignum sp.]MCF8138498.1 PAS domain S-box protein [Desulfotignum sp.]